MDTLSFTQILTDGAILSIALGALVIGTLYYNPRLWLQDYPAEMRAKVPPLTAQEKWERAIAGTMLLAIILGVLVYSVSQLRAANGGSVVFFTAYLHVFGVLSIFNIFDAVVLDLLLLTGIKPKFATLPGTEGMEYLYHDWGTHLANFLKGVVFCAVFSLPVALVASL